MREGRGTWATLPGSCGTPRPQRFTAFTEAGPLAGSGQGEPDSVAGNLAATRKEHNLHWSGYQAAAFALDSPEVPDWLKYGLHNKDSELGTVYTFKEHEFLCNDSGLERHLGYRVWGTTFHFGGEGV